MAKKQIKEIEYNPIVHEVLFEDVLHNSMIPYSESVILDRSIPRVEDGLKPVQRRILFTMHEMGLTPDKPYKKCARIVGDCLGKFHPHGDSSVYEAMVRMAQPFSMRMKLVDGHGNFGSVDGDRAAAYRYTEARMSALALELLRDIDKETVSWNPNFDDSVEEPVVLPGRFPNLLVNGASGIAVGLATNIPPHNMDESIDAVCMMIDNQNVTLDELLTVFKGPDFPTGGFIIPIDSIKSIYETGKGRISIRSRLHIEDESNGKKSIVITELPYAVKKSELLQKIAELRDKNKDILQDIADIVEESDRNGMRAVIKLKKDSDPNKVLAVLFKKTDLEKSYAINMVAIANGKPEQMGLVDILRYYIDYQQSIIVKRTTFELKNANKRALIIKGLIVAIDNIDEVIKIIKESDSTMSAKQTLMSRFDLVDEQAQAILDMRLKALARLEISRLREELDALVKLIAKLEGILGSKSKQLKVVKSEILEIKARMTSKRMSAILADNSGDTFEVPSADEVLEYKEGVICTNIDGKMRFMSQKSFSLGQKNLASYEAHEQAQQSIEVNTNGVLYAFSNLGNMIKLNVADFPEKKWRDKPFTLSQMSPDAKPNEKVVKLLYFDSVPFGELIMFTKNGNVKRTDLVEFASCRTLSGAIILSGDDELVAVEVADVNLSCIEISDDGQSLLYPVGDVPTQGRKAGGVKGIKLNDGAKVIYAGLVDDEGEIVVCTSTGYIKRVITSTLEIASRYQKGVKIAELSDSKIVYANPVKMPYDIMIVSDTNTIVNTEDIRLDTRQTKGKQMIKTAVSAVVKIN